jgi:hypothetical protein
MTVIDTTNRISELGNGINLGFDFPFKIFQGSDLLIYKVNTSTGLSGVQILGTDYTVSLNTVVDGGTVTYTLPPLATETSLIIRNVDAQQSSAFPAASVFPEVTIENALDKAMINIQQLESSLDRAVVLSESSLTNTPPTLPNPETGKTIKWTAGGSFENSAEDPDTEADAVAAAAAAAISAAAAAVAAGQAYQTYEPYTQVAHGLVAQQVVYRTASGTWAAASTSTLVTSKVVGIISIVTDVDNFIIVSSGVVKNLTLSGIGNIGDELFLSSTPGGLSTIASTVAIGIKISNTELLLTLNPKPRVLNTFTGWFLERPSVSTIRVSIGEGWINGEYQSTTIPLDISPGMTASTWNTLAIVNDGTAPSLDVVVNQSSPGTGTPTGANTLKLGAFYTNSFGNIDRIVMYRTGEVMGWSWLLGDGTAAIEQTFIHGAIFTAPPIPSVTSLGSILGSSPLVISDFNSTLGDGAVGLFCRNVSNTQFTAEWRRPATTYSTTRRFGFAFNFKGGYLLS